MKKFLLALAIFPFTVAASSPGEEIAWDLVEGLTTEIGPRQAGTEAEERAREWSVQKLMALGFSNVRIEPFKMPTWVRGDERGSLLITRNGRTVAHKLAITALGNSGATPDKGIEGEIIFFRSVEALKAAPDAAVKGKIVYITHAMQRAQDGSSYGYFGPVRRTGPNLAAKKGAMAIVIRGLGTDQHRNPHTGNTNFNEGVKPIPAAAVSNPDADHIERHLRLWADQKGALAPRFRLVMTPRFIGQQTSGNVIAEVPGTDPNAGIVLVSGHLDSWDLGTGAFDDGAGVAITAGAAANILNSGRTPRRTIRLVWFGAEEVGLWGGKAYAEKHKATKHALVAESDFGADRIWRLDLKLPEGAKAIGDRLATALAPLGIAASKQEAGGGPDIGFLVAAGAPAIDLQQDGTRYFDLHHTPDDTLDKIDRAQFNQNVQAWTIMLNEVANAPEALIPAPEVIVGPAEVMPTEETPKVKTPTEPAPNTGTEKAAPPNPAQKAPAKSSKPKATAPSAPRKPAARPVTKAEPKSKPKARKP